MAVTDLEELNPGSRGTKSRQLEIWLGSRKTYKLDLFLDICIH